jgi:invasion protein IalB
MSLRTLCKVARLGDEINGIMVKKRTNQYLTPAAHIRAALTAIMVLVLLSPGVAQSETLGTYGDWSTFKTTNNGNKVCYIGSEPQKSEGDYTTRGDTFVLVTHRPDIGELNVVSVRAGYKYKENSNVAVTIDGSSNTLFALGEMAWARDVKSDQELVAAMRKGNAMIIHGISWRGTQTTDTYSLKGFTRAYKNSLAACGIK